MFPCYVPYPPGSFTEFSSPSLHRGDMEASLAKASLPARYTVYAVDTTALRWVKSLCLSERPFLLSRASVPERIREEGERFLVRWVADQCAQDWAKQAPWPRRRGMTLRTWPALLDLPTPDDWGRLHEALKTFASRPPTDEDKKAFRAVLLGVLYEATPEDDDSSEGTP